MKDPDPHISNGSDPQPCEHCVMKEDTLSSLKRRSFFGERSSSINLFLHSLSWFFFGLNVNSIALHRKFEEIRNISQCFWFFFSFTVSTSKGLFKCFIADFLFIFVPAHLLPVWLFVCPSLYLFPYLSISSMNSFCLTLLIVKIAVSGIY